MLTRQCDRRQRAARRTAPTVRTMLATVLLGICCAVTACAPADVREGDMSAYGPGGETGVKSLVPEGVDLDAVRFTVGGSGVLIGSRTVLTAGHVGPTLVHGATVSFGSDGTAPLFERTAVAAVVMPGYDGGGDNASLEALGATGTHDLQMVLLDEPVPESWRVSGAAVPVTPALLRFDPYVVACRRCVRHVGYGLPAGGGEDDRQKRTVVSDIDTVTPSKLSYRGTCHGDSGGPAFAMINSIERVVGIVNSGDDACRSFAMDIRIDRPEVRTFVQGQLRTWDDCDDNPNCVGGSGDPT